MKIQTWEQADEGLRDLGLCEVQLEQIKARLDKGMARLRERAAKLAAPDQERTAELRLALETFWDNHKAEVQPAKSRKLTWGEIGSIASKAVAFLENWKPKAIIAAIARRPSLKEKFLRVTTSLNKEAVHKASGEEMEKLKLCGVAIEWKDRFFAEPIRARLVAAEDGVSRAAAD